MILKQRLFSNMFFRNMTADLIGRTAYSKSPGAFTPYFQYKIGHYEPDQYLYFPKEPYAIRYYNEIFNKLYEYKGYDIINYLEFHFTTYPNKHDFLRFLQYEIADRTKRRLQKANQLKLQSASGWVIEKQQELLRTQQLELKREIEAGVREAFPSDQTSANPEEIENVVQKLSFNLSDRLEKLLIQTEERMEFLTGAFVTGNVELNNQNHLEKVIQIFKMLQSVQAPTHIAKAEQVFKKFSDTDIASILRLHFESFKDKKLNTLQVKIREANDRLHPSNPKFQKLTAALQEFFY